MAESESADDKGISYKGTAGEFSASARSVDGFLETVEITGTRVLAWSERNPTQFYAVLIFLLLGFLIWSRTRVKIAEQKNEYARRRLEPRGQIALPLPKPPPSKDE